MITVAISKARLEAFGADVHAGIHILEKLRAAGIPVRGVLLPMGVAEGTLTMTDSDLSAELVWQWDGEEGLA